MQPRPISAIIFGILNIGFGAFSWLELLFFRPMSDVTKTAGPYSPLAALATDANTAHWLYLTGLVDSAASIVLVAGGIGLLIGKNWGRSASIGWGFFDIVFTLIRVPLNFRSAHAAVIALKAPAALAGIVVWGATILGTLLGLAYPLLLLFFLTRPKLKAAFENPPLTPPPPSST